jgi:predicted membrane-bound mannosyltransferase
MALLQENESYTTESTFEFKLCVYLRLINAWHASRWNEPYSLTDRCSKIKTTTITVVDWIPQLYQNLTAMIAPGEPRMH